MILRPRAIDVCVVVDQLLEVVDFGVEVVEAVERDRFERHRQFRRAEFVLAMMADNHVLQPQRKLRGKFFARQFLRLSQLLVEHAEAQARHGRASDRESV